LKILGKSSAGYADAGVGNCDFDRVGGLVKAIFDQHLAPFGRVLDGIVQQVAEDDLQPHVAGHDDAGVIGDLVSQGNLLLIGLGRFRAPMIFSSIARTLSGWSGAWAGAGFRG